MGGELVLFQSPILSTRGAFEDFFDNQSRKRYGLGDFFVSPPPFDFFFFCTIRGCFFFSFRFPAFIFFFRRKVLPRRDLFRFLSLFHPGAWQCEIVVGTRLFCRSFS